MRRTAKVLSWILTFAMLFSCFSVPAFADSGSQTIKYFADAQISDEMRNSDMFFFGSTNMSISEKDKNTYIMKVERGGSLEDEAAISVKFTDISSSYGKNYKIGIYESGEIIPIESDDTMSIVDFFEENKDSQVEMESYSEEEVQQQIAESGGFSVENGDGEVVASTIVETDENGEPGGYSVVTPEGETAIEAEVGEGELETNADEVVTPEYTEEELQQEENNLIRDDFPGTEVRIVFAPGESCKYIAVNAIDSSESEGDATAVIFLKDPSAGYSVPDNIGESLLIKDEDNGKNAVLSLEKNHYVVEPDEDTVDIVVERKNAKNMLVSASIVSYSETADMGVDYQGIDAKVDFSPGMYKRTVTLKVNHGDEDEEFKVKLMSPAGCELEEETATVTIKKKDSSAENEAVILCDGQKRSGDDAVFSNRLAAGLSPSDFNFVNNARVDGDSIYLSGKGRSNNEWEVAEYRFKNPYLYDGVRLIWKDWWDGWLSRSYVAMRTFTDSGQSTIFSIDRTNSTNTVCAMFNERKANGFKFEILTSACNGLQAKVWGIQPIYRQFEFELVDADLLEYKGVKPDEVAKLYLNAQFAGYDGTQRKIQVVTGNAFTVCAPSSQVGYARLAGVEILDGNGKKLTYLENTTNSRSVTVNLTESLMNTLTMTRPDAIEYTSVGDGAYLGKGLKVKPVFEYIDATVTIKPSEIGSFDGEYKVEDYEKQFNLHLGDKIKLTSVVKSVYDGEYVGDGVEYQFYDGENKIIASGQIDYLKGDGMDFEIASQNITLKPKFSIANNAVKVRIKNSDANMFDKESGIFVLTPKIEGDYSVYTLTDTHVYMNQFTFMTAETKNDGMVAVWSVPGIEKTYSGNTFYYPAGRTAEENIITLSAKNAFDISISGKVYDSSKNLSTGISAVKPTIPCANALVTAGGKGTVSAQDGAFSLEGVKAAEGTKARFLVYANSTYVLKDIDVTTSKSYNMGIISAAANTLDTAHFNNVYFAQDGRNVVSTETLKMNGKKLELTASVSDGNEYKYKNEVRKEKVTGVTFYVLEAGTNKVKGSYEANEKSDGIWTAEIPQFSPDKPAEFSFGDVFYVAMTTDKPSAVADETNNQSQEEDSKIKDQFNKTTYAMVSTGFQITQDLDYKPQTINLSLPVDASAALGSSDSNLSEEEEPHKTDKSFASIPFIGEINAMCGFLGFLKIGKVNLFAKGSVVKYSKFDPTDGINYDNALADLDDGIFEENQEKSNEPIKADSSHQSTGSKLAVKVNIIAHFSELPYGGTRFTIGARVTVGNMSAYNGAGFNPVETWLGMKDGSINSDKAGEYILSKASGKSTSAKNYSTNFATTQLGNPMMTFGIEIGVYIDFGYIKEKDVTTGETKSKFFDSKNWVFLGAGGYLSLSGRIELQYCFLFPLIHIPGYMGVIGEARVTGYLGANKDPNKVLKYSDMMEQEEVNLNKLKFNPELFVNFSVKGYAGVGLADVLGARLTAGFSLDYSLAPRLKEAYKAINTNYGLGLNFNVGGQLDLVVLSIPFSGFSIPLKNWGFTEYFTEVYRARLLCTFCSKSLNEGDGRYKDESIKSKVRSMVDRLIELIQTDRPADEIKNLKNELCDYCYSNDIISWHQKNLVKVITSPFMSLAEEGDTQNSNDGIALIGHSENEWVGGTESEENIELSGAFAPVGTKILMNKSISQPESKIIDLGMDNDGHEKLLSVFLMDVSNPGETQRANLAYSVYDCTDETWSDPELLPLNGAYQYSPSIKDLGNDIVINVVENTDEDFEADNPIATLQNLDICTMTISKEDFLEGRQFNASFTKLTNESAFYRNPISVYVEPEFTENGNDAVVTFYTKNTTKSSEVSEYIYAKPETSSISYTAYDPDSGEIIIAESEVPVNNEKDAILSFSAESDHCGNILFAYTTTDSTSDDVATSKLYVGSINIKSGEVTLINLPVDSDSMARPRMYFQYRERYALIDEDSEDTELIPGDVYLTWMENQGDLMAFNLSDFMKYDVKDGVIKERKTGSAEDNVFPIFTKNEKDASIAISDNYEVFADNEGNAYVMWSNTVEDSDPATKNDITTPPAREIFAIASSAIVDEYDGAGVTYSKWSEPYRLTYSEHCNDGLSAAVAMNGNLYVLHNQYDMTYIGDTEEYMSKNYIDANGNLTGNPYKISDTTLCVTTMLPVGTVGAETIKLSDNKPLPGHNVKIDLTFENTGLTAAKGFSADVWTYKNGTKVEKLSSIESNDTLLANETVSRSVMWKNVPEDIAGMQILVETTENSYSTVDSKFSEEFETTADLNIYSLGVSQADAWDNIDGVAVDSVTYEEFKNFTLDYIVSNIGNRAYPEGSKVVVMIDPLYEKNQNAYYGKDKVLAEEPLESVPANDYILGEVSFAVPVSVFDDCGYDQISLRIVDAEGNEVGDIANDYIKIELPYDYHLNGGKDYSISKGESVKLQVENSSEFLSNYDEIIYWTENPDIADVKDGKLVGMSAGTTKVYAYSLTYGIKDSVGVTVKGGTAGGGGGGPVTPSTPDTPSAPDTPTVPDTPAQSSDGIGFIDVPDNAWYKDIVDEITEKGIMNGTSEKTFEPQTELTRGMFVTMLHRLEGEPVVNYEMKFKDVDQDKYYCEAVRWATSEKIVSGMSEEEFAPDKSITREEIAAILYRYARYKETDVEKVAKDFDTSSYKDIDKVSKWAADAMYFCLAAGLINGDENSYISPQDNATRAQTAAILLRYIEEYYEDELNDEQNAMQEEEKALKTEAK